MLLLMFRFFLVIHTRLYNYLGAQFYVNNIHYNEILISLQVLNLFLLLVYFRVKIYWNITFSRPYNERITLTIL